MNVFITQMMRLVDQIKRAERMGNEKEFEALVDKMMDQCEHVKTKLHQKHILQTKVKLKLINELMFIYKPILKKNYYEGTYLEEFSKIRTMELKDANALSIHNQFWKNHEVLRGNIFGSVPTELIGNDCTKKLRFLGWDEVKVGILEVKNRICSMKDFVELCEKKYQNFLIVKEKSTGCELLLEYKIEKGL